MEHFAPARAVLTNCFQDAAQSGVQHVEWGHEAVCEQREGLARLPERLRAIESSVAAVFNFVDQQREAGIDARLKTVDVFLANAYPPLDTTRAQERFQADEAPSRSPRRSSMQYTEDSISHMDSNTPVLDAGSYERLLSMEALLAALFDSSPGMAERRRSAVQSLKQPSIPNVARDEPEWFFCVPPRLQTIENSMAVTLERFMSTFTSLPRSEASRSDRLRTV